MKKLDFCPQDVLITKSSKISECQIPLMFLQGAGHETAVKSLSNSH